MTESNTTTPPAVGARGATAKLQTLQRGLDVLELLATEGPLANSDVANRLDLHRSIVYRVLRTLEERGFAERDSHGRYQLGAAVAGLGHAVRQNLQQVALPELTALAELTRATAFMAVPDGDHAVTLLYVEPRRADGTMVVYRPTARHPLTRSATGIAILAARPPSPDERPEITSARELGYVRTSGELTPGLSGLGAPVPLADGSATCVALVFVEGHLDEDLAIEQLVASAKRISAAPLSA